MITAHEITAARAALPRILPMPLKRVGNFLVGLCPIHEEQTPSFTVYPSDWHFYCFGCGAYGDAISWTQRTKGLAFPDAVRQLVSTNYSSRFARGVLPAARRAPRATEVPSFVSTFWAQATAPHIAQFYLETRGLRQKALSAALRGHLAVPCKEVGERRPCMLAAVSDHRGRITAIQRTWVEDRIVHDGQTDYEKGARCPDLSAGKKCLGPLGTGAVRLAAAGEILGLAEGVESALAAAKLFRLPVWAVCGSQRLGSIELPECVKHVVIFGDEDISGAGQAAAAKADWIYRRRGYSVQTEFPEVGRDWAGMLAR